MILPLLLVKCEKLYITSYLFYNLTKSILASPPSPSPRQPQKKIPNRKKLKQISITGIDNIVDFTNKLSWGDKSEFKAKMSRNYVKISPTSLREKFSIWDFLEVNNIQIYVIPDRDIPIKIRISRFLRSTSNELIKLMLNYRWYNATRISQIKSLKEERLLPISSRSIPKLKPYSKFIMLDPSEI